MIIIQVTTHQGHGGVIVNTRDCASDFGEKFCAINYYK